MEVALCLAISNLVEHDLRLDVDSGRFSDKDSLEALEHLQNVDGVHAAVLVVIAELEHHCSDKE